MQSMFMAALMELAQEDPSVVYLTADSGEGGLDLMYRRNFPDRAINFGIAEENMVAAAAGMASCNKIPFVYTAAPFLVYRAMEFLRDDVCLMNMPVKLIGSGSGLSVGPLGPTHHTTEDIGILRTLPGLTVLSPATPLQAYACVKKAYEIPGPVYIRLGMSKEAEYFQEGYELNKSVDVLREGQDVLLISTGAILEEVMKAADLLTQQGVTVSVVSVPVLKPFPSQEIWALAKGKSLVCTVEEHSELGGLGTCVAEALMEGYQADLQMNGKTTASTSLVLPRLLKMGLKDCFSKGYGTAAQVRKENGLGAENICEKILAGRG